MGAGTWATVALGQGLPYFEVGLADMRYHEVMDHLKGGRQEVPKCVFVWVSALESI